MLAVIYDIKNMQCSLCFDGAHAQTSLTFRSQARAVGGTKISPAVRFLDSGTNLPSLKAKSRPACPRFLPLTQLFPLLGFSSAPLAAFIVCRELAKEAPGVTDSIQDGRTPLSWVSFRVWHPFCA